MAERERTEYFDVADPTLSGKFSGEVVKDGEKGYFLHLRAPKGQSLARRGEGDIVIPDISVEGWKKVQETIGSLGPDASITDVKRALSESPLLNAVKEVVQR